MVVIVVFWHLCLPLFPESSGFIKTAIGPAHIEAFFMPESPDRLSRESCVKATKACASPQPKDPGGLGLENCAAL